MEPNQKPDAEIIAQLARDSVPRHSPLSLQQWPMESGVPPTLVWPDQKVSNLEGLLPRPLRKRGSARLVTVLSFIDYVQKHRTPGTALCGDANEKGGNFCAILDHHEPNPAPAAEGQEVDRSVPQPHWSEHRVDFILETTPEWVRWLGICAKDLDQKSFAEFLEDNAADVADPGGPERTPSAADLLQLATTLQIKTDIRFASGINLSNGQIQLRYEEMIDGSWGGEARMSVPQCFWIGVVPFRGGLRYLVKIRLRYRGSSGKANFRLEIERPHKVVEAAFNDTKHTIEEATGLAVWVGSLAPQQRAI
jgi:uncharacterized protein YfdQ (DUF2303 family)